MQSAADSCALQHIAGQTYVHVLGDDIIQRQQCRAEHDERVSEENTAPFKLLKRSRIMFKPSCAPFSFQQ